MQLNKASFSFCCHLFIEAEQGIPCRFLSEAKGRKGTSNTLLYYKVSFEEGVNSGAELLNPLKRIKLILKNLVNSYKHRIFATF